MTSGKLLPALALCLNALIWGLSWWPFRQFEGQGLHPLWTTVLVYLLAVAAISIARRGAWGQLLRTPALWVLVLASGTTNAAFNWAMTIGDVVRVVLLFYLMPLWAVLLARLLLHERLTRLALLRVALAFTGAVIVLSPEGGGLPLPSSLPDWLAIVGGFSFALNNVMLRREAAQPEAARALAMFCGGVLVAAALASLLALQGLAAWPPLLSPGWGLAALGLGGFFLISNLALQFGAARLPANATAVIMLVEVPVASGSALLLGGGAITWAIATGGLLILAAALLAALENSQGH
nr:DMT family transporter [uncultured Roseateles sp.]